MQIKTLSKCFGNDNKKNILFDNELFLVGDTCQPVSSIDFLNRMFLNVYWLCLAKG